jgi:hypothetical protein
VACWKDTLLEEIRIQRYCCCSLALWLRTTLAALHVQVKSIAEMGAYVSLLEYNGIEGMILLSELSRRRIRSITKLIKVSSTYTHMCGGPWHSNDIK